MLVPLFTKQTGTEVKVIAVGTGAAVEMGAKGDADAVLVHAPASEKPYVDRGELVGGIALFLGAFTRPVGVAVGLMLMCFSLAGSSDHTQYALLLALCAFACALSRAGRRLGLDAILDGHFPAWISWTRAEA